MFTAFSTALSALNANAAAVSVVGSNLANLNTPGYKNSVVMFRDMVTNSTGAGLGETQARFGVAQPAAVPQFSQGAVQSSSGALDAAVEGDGFFVLRDNNGGRLFTRAGNFHADVNGRLLTLTGDRVQGWTVDTRTGRIDTNVPVGDITFPVGWLKPPLPTTYFTLDLNLDGAAPVDGKPNLSYPVEAHDSLGTPHILTVEFTKTDSLEWTYEVKMPAEDFVGGTEGAKVSIATGSLTFDDKGQLIDPPADEPVTLTLEDLASGSADIDIEWSLYNDAGKSRLTQYSEASSVSGATRDGSGAAQLMRVGLADGGKIVAQFSDEQQMVVGLLAVASICNPESLSAQGNNSYRLSAESATPVVGLPGTGGRGKIVGASLEASTVDVATEFTNLLVYQRAYQANSRVITSADQLSQETINLIR